MQTNSLDADRVERETGIEPVSLAWKAKVLPLNYTRRGGGGGGRIRTYEGISQQIYSLPPLAAWVPLRGHKPAIVFSEQRSVNTRSGESRGFRSSRGVAVEQSHQIGLAFGQAKAGYQTLRLVRAVDRLPIRARFDR